MNEAKLSHSTLPAASHRRIFTFILIAGVALFLMFMTVLEELLSARYYERHRIIAPDYFPSIHYPHKRLRYGLVPNLDYYGWFKINSSGYRGQELPVQKSRGTVRVLCLGGSTTFDSGTVGANQPWPEVLEAELRKRLGTDAIEVANLGIPGATSLDSLIDLQIRGLPLKPDLVIVYQGHNDLIYSAGYTTKSDLFPLEEAPRTRLERWLTLNSLLYAKGGGRITAMLQRLTSSLSFRSAEPFPPRDRTRTIAQGLSAYRDNLKSIAAIAHANGIQLVVPQLIVPFPEQGSQGSCAVCAGLAKVYLGLPIPQIRSTFEDYRRVIKDLGMEREIHYVATTDFVPSADRYYRDSVHFGPEGSFLMGTKLAEAIAPIVQGIRNQAAAGRSRVARAPSRL